MAAPAIPTSLQIASGDSKALVKWAASTDDADAATLLAYNVYRDASLVHTTAAGVTTYTDIGLTNGQTYSYRVSAVDTGAAESDQCAAITCTPGMALGLPAVLPAAIILRGKEPTMTDLMIKLTKKQLKALASGIAIVVNVESSDTKVIVEPVADEPTKQ